MKRSWVLWLFVSLLVACGGVEITELGSWEQGADMLSARSEMPAVVLGDRIYVPGGFGGDNDFAAYDPATDSWEELADLPQGKHHQMFAKWNGRLFLFGGTRGFLFNPSNTAWVYEPASDTWSDIAPMPELRHSGAAVTLDNFIYIIGGSGGTNALLRYDPVQNQWDSLAPLQHSREHTAAVVYEGEIYALAGRWSGQGELTSVEIYNPEDDSWRAGVPMEVARGGFGTAVLHNQIIVVGGEVLSGDNHSLTSVESYNPATATWSSLPDLPVGIHGVPAAVVDDTLYVIGGPSSNTS
ncbi:MAG: kelch repeat-containing protein, partial [Chloroflexota bacterium]